MKLKLLSIFLMLPFAAFSQLTINQAPTGGPLPPAAPTATQASLAWYRGGNLGAPGFENIFGTFWNSEVHHYTNGIRRFTTSTNNGLSNTGFSTPVWTGDGISIANHINSASFASIDLFTGTSNQTFLRMGQAFLTQTTNNRVEQIANFQGFWYNATGVGSSGSPGTAQYKWAITGTERGRLGSNGKWRFGTTAANANNRVEITSGAGDPYWPTNASGLRFTNLLASSPTVPAGTNGVNNAKVLTVDNNGDVVLTNAFGGPISANNGLQITANTVQLGGDCTNPVQVGNATILSNRKVPMKGFLVFDQFTPFNTAPISGRVGFGDFPQCTAPGNLVEITKTQAANGVPSGISGLRLGDLRAGAGANPPNGQALSVNANGDVILVQAAIGGGNTTICNTIPINNVTKNVGGNTICETNITDLNPIGLVGINNINPNDALDVNNLPGSTGDIDINNPFSRYEINDDPILWHKGVSDNLFIGVGAGQLTPTGPSGNDNVVIGHDAYSNMPMTGANIKNVIIGSHAADNFSFGGVNDVVYIGYKAGASADGVNNTFVGCQAGMNNVPGADENVFVGWHTGMNNSGVHNTFMGNLSGVNNFGSNNTFIGIGSGMNANGFSHSSLGAGSGPGVAGINNTTALGENATTMVSNSVILGDNACNTGIGLSANPVGPLNKLEINTTAGSPYFGSPNGSSGLKFRNMNAGNTPIANPGNGVLGLDGLGNVIYVNAPVGGGGGVGNYCNAAPSPLIGNYEVPMNNFRYYFPGQGVINAAQQENIVSVGYNCNQIPPAHFSVLEAQTGGPTVQTYAGHFKNDNQSQVGFNYITGGVYGEAKGLELGLPMANPGVNAGGVFEGFGTRASIGVFGRMSNVSLPYPGSIGAPNARYAIGGAFMSDDMTTNPWGAVANIGAYGHASNSLVMSAGVYAHTTLNTAGMGFNYGIYTNSPVGPGNLALYADGDVFINGTGTISPSPWIVSDARFKKDVVGIQNAMEMLKKFRPTQYHHKSKNSWGMNFDDRLSYGFIAQEVEKDFPELVKEQRKPLTKDEKGNILTEEITFKAVNYTALVPMLVKGVQEQQAEIESQSSALSTLKTELENQKKLNQELLDRMGKLEQLLLQNATTTVRQEVSIGNPASIVLNQNVPNPFAEKTLISYVIPREAKTAQIHFLNNQGASIKVVELTERGKGELLVYAEDLSTGIYTYTLVVDGNVMDSKKMLKQ
jgi:hypothetical protein